MGEVVTDSYWCHMCSQIVNPIIEIEMKCPFCDSGFVEEMDSAGSDGGLGGVIDEDEDDNDDLSDRSLSVLAPILLGMLGSRPRRRRQRLPRADDESDSDQDHDTEVLLRRRLRNSIIFQLLERLRDDFGLENETPERERGRERERDRESVLLINPFNEAILLQGTFESEEGHESNAIGGAPAGTLLGDYFIGPSLDMLLQHLTENDPNRYGTAPAKKEAIDAMPNVKIEESLNCSVCLDDFEIGAEAREMPCKHKFHGGCILPWLELHSSCPVCRFQIPADESKSSDESGWSTRAGGGIAIGDESNDGNGNRSAILWSLNSLFLSSRSRRGRNYSSNPSSSSTSETNSHEDES